MHKLWTVLRDLKQTLPLFLDTEKWTASKKTHGFLFVFHVFCVCSLCNLVAIVAEPEVFYSVFSQKIEENDTFHRILCIFVLLF